MGGSDALESNAKAVKRTARHTTCHGRTGPPQDGDGDSSSGEPPRTRLQYLARRLHALGPKPLFHFLDEVERGAPLRAHLETYAELPADFIKANGGDQFMPRAFLVREDVSCSR